LNATKPSPLEPRYIAQTDTWKVIKCEGFLDKDSSSRLRRAFYLPAWILDNPYIRVVLGKLKLKLSLRWADYCILQRNVTSER
jgi:hypothetical protein